MLATDPKIKDEIQNILHTLDNSDNTGPKNFIRICEKLSFIKNYFSDKRNIYANSLTFSLNICCVSLKLLLASSMMRFICRVWILRVIISFLLKNLKRSWVIIILLVINDMMFNKRKYLKRYNL